MPLPETALQKVLFSNQEILERISQLAEEVAGDFRTLSPQQQEKGLVLVCVLESARVFSDELHSALDALGVNCRVLSLKASSYGKGMQSSGVVEITPFFDLTELADQNVLLVEDMIDTGLTLKELAAVLAGCSPSVLHIVVLLKKAKSIDAAQAIPHKIYVGFDIIDLWVHGFGIDTAEEYRELINILAVLLSPDDLSKYESFMRKKAKRQVKTVRNFHLN